MRAVGKENNRNKRKVPRIDNYLDNENRCDLKG